jgi:hypothetical protein
MLAASNPVKVGVNTTYTATVTAPSGSDLNSRLVELLDEEHPIGS